MVISLWVLALLGTAQADPAEQTPAPGSIELIQVEEPAARTVSTEAAQLGTAAYAWARSPQPQHLQDGQEHLAALAGLLIAGPDLATSQAGLGIQALCVWADATGDDAALGVAIATAEWALSDRQLDPSGFSSHGDPSSPPALVDSVAVGQALLALYTSTGDERWLLASQATAGFIGARFLSGGRGFASVSSLDSERLVDLGENVETVRFLATLGHMTGEPRWSGMARHGLAWLRSAPDADVMLAVARVVDERPVHIVIVGPREDVETAALFDAARALPLTHRWLEWRDPQTWVAAPSAVQVPLTGPPSAYLCDGLDCGGALRTPAEVAGLRFAFEESSVAEGNEEGL